MCLQLALRPFTCLSKRFQATGSDGNRTEAVVICRWVARGEKGRSMQCCNYGWYRTITYLGWAQTGTRLARLASSGADLF